MTLRSKHGVTELKNALTCINELHMLQGAFVQPVLRICDSWGYVLLIIAIRRSASCSVWSI